MLKHAPSPTTGLSTAIAPSLRSNMLQVRPEIPTLNLPKSNNNNDDVGGNLDTSYIPKVPFNAALHAPTHDFIDCISQKAHYTDIFAQVRGT